jgi:ATP-dependent Clp protease protease subunit
MAKKNNKEMIRRLLNQQSDDNTIWVTEFDVESVQDFYDRFVEWEAEPTAEIIPVYINSFGGQVYSLIAKRDLIKTSIKPVSTIAVGKAMSCGASLLAAGTKGYRYASPDTRILVHQVSGVNVGKTSDIVEDAKQIATLNDMMLKNLAEDTGNSVSKLKNEIKNRENADWTMTAEEALKWKLIDGIGIPRVTWSPGEGSLQLFVDKKTAQQMKEEALRIIASQGKPAKKKK